MEKDNRSSAVGRPAIAIEDQGPQRAAIAEMGYNQNLNDLAVPLERTIFGAASCLYEFFHFNGYRIERGEILGNTVDPALKSYVGWIYAFYDGTDVPLYVGETKRTFNARFAEHSFQPWWPNWSEVKILPCPNQAIRKIFESLIGLAGGYVENKMQPSGGDNLLDDIVLSLMALGNDNDRHPTFPNKMILNQAKSIRQELKHLGVT